MRQRNAALFGLKAAPLMPEKHYEDGDFGLKAMALRFLHRRCEDLRFDPARREAEEAEGRYGGASFLPGQIPYDMQMDIDRLCLERELERFIDSGAAEDAYTVYYCYLEMFFGRYGRSKKMVELLSEFESNGSSLLMKHRDHYSHSVYVFTLGLAVYEACEPFRRTFRRYCGFDPAQPDADRAAACCFLEYWGLTALFHDIGYPFELPFEQVLSYFEVTGESRGKGSLYLAYRDLDALTKLGEEARARFEALYGRAFDTTEALFAHGITEKLGDAYRFTEDYVLGKIHDKPLEPNAFGYYMDHAYFSAARLYREIEGALGPARVTEKHVDALTAILLHNSLFKFALSFYKDEEKHGPPLPMDLHPLAWLLMLCDELQCWDRTAYGRNSRTELHPMAADFDFSRNALRATYYYDAEEQEKIDDFRAAYRRWEAEGERGKPPRLKAYSDMAEKEQRFTRDIRQIVDLEHCPLTVLCTTRRADHVVKHTYLSISSFLHIYNFAVALHARYAYQGDEENAKQEDMEKAFNSLSLEYKISNINQVRSFGQYLNEIGCFYTDRPVDFDMLTEFTKGMINRIAPLEHERWVRDHQMMGWRPGDDYETVPLDIPKRREAKARKALREQMRMHKLTLAADADEETILKHYESLPPIEQEKDFLPFNSLLKLLKIFDGVRIYKLD
jgi:hypothetical protein